MLNPSHNTTYAHKSFNANIIDTSVIRYNPLKYTINTLFSMLKETTKIGLTFGQILTALGLLGGIIGAYVSLSSRITAIEVDQKNSNAKYTEIREDVKALQVDNKTDHIILQNTIRDYNKELMQEISKLHK